MSMRGAFVVAIVSYVLFCLFWFDYRRQEILSFLPAFLRSPVIPAVVFAIALGVLLRQKGFPKALQRESDNRLAVLFFVLSLNHSHPAPRRGLRNP